MTLTVAIRLRAFAQTGAAPPPAACAAHMVAIEGCAWTGLVLVLNGASANWVLFGVFIAPARYLPPGTATPGASLLYFAVPCLLLGTILQSCAACVLHGMPGVGRSRTHCCCPERRQVEVYALPVAGRAPPGLYAMPGAAGGVLPGMYGVGGGAGGSAPPGMAAPVYALPAQEGQTLARLNYLQLNNPKGVYSV